MKQTRFDYSQEYIPHGYMELCIPSKDGKVFCFATVATQIAFIFVPASQTITPTGHLLFRCAITPAEVALRL